jgi:hypothetical protein
MFAFGRLAREVDHPGYVEEIADVHPVGGDAVSVPELPGHRRSVPS